MGTGQTPTFRDTQMTALQLYYGPDDDPIEIADRARMNLPESERWITNIILSPLCMKPKSKRQDAMAPGRMAPQQQTFFS